jgi:hypothetical protein
MAICDTYQLPSSLLKLSHYEILPAAINGSCCPLSLRDRVWADGTDKLPYRLSDVAMHSEEQWLGPDGNCAGMRQ